MEYKEYQIQQIDKIKMRLGAKEQILKNKGYNLEYDTYCEADFNENGEEEGKSVFVQITISPITSKDKALDYYFCLCKNIGGADEKEFDSEEFIEGLLVDIQRIEKEGKKAFRKIHANQMIERSKKLYSNQFPFSVLFSLGLGKSILLLSIIGIIGFLLIYIFFIIINL